MSHGSFTKVALLNFLLSLLLLCKQVAGVLDSEGSVGGSKDNHFEYETIRKEMIKAQILQRLGLQEKPRVDDKLSKDLALEVLKRTENLHLSSDVSFMEANATAQPEDDSNFAKTSEIISFANRGPVLNGHVLLSFSYAGNNAFGAGVRVKKAHIWIKMDYRTSMGRHFGHLLHPKGVTLYVFQITGNFQTRRNQNVHLTSEDVHMDLVTSRTIMLDSLGWQKLDVTQTVQKWYSRNNRHRIRHGGSGSHPGKSHHSRDRLTLLVDCAGCANSIYPILLNSTSPVTIEQTDSDSRLDDDDQTVETAQKENGEIPFLVLETESSPSAKRNRRRTLECGPRVKNCCKQRFYVSFQDLGWDDWIIAPKGYYANYCRGSCGGPLRTPDTFLNYHTHVIEEYRRTPEGQANLAGLNPCCAPTKWSPMSLIYFGPDYNIIKRDLPKMIVEECGCP